jgi:hypothetical protein
LLTGRIGETKIAWEGSTGRIMSSLVKLLGMVNNIKAGWKMGAGGIRSLCWGAGVDNVIMSLQIIK